MGFIKDPDAVLDYAVDWASWLQAGETIAASTWVVGAGITETTPAPSHDSTLATIWLAAGTAGSSYTVTNHVTTNQGRQDDRSFVVRVEQR